MANKKYTVEEANALLPYLSPTLVELREKFEEAARIRAQIAQLAARNGGQPRNEEWRDTLTRVAELIKRLEEWEIELRDVETGLIDFPATIEDKDAYLCWRLGEPDVAYWHTLEGGFAGRRPL
jgi:hypothetical protein